MPTFEYQTRLPFSREDVFAWYSRPGALTRLHPPFAGRVLSEPSRGLETGSESVLGINLPGLLGTAVTAAADMVSTATSLPLRSWMRWQARHTDFEPGRGFSDEMVSGPASQWRHEHRFDDDGAGTIIKETVEYQLPLTDRLPRAVASAVESRMEAELRRIFDFRQRQTTQDLAFHQSHGMLASQEGENPGQSVRVAAVSGSGGLIGRQVCALLSGAGVQVRPMVRRTPDSSQAAGGEILWDPEAGTLDPADLEEVDVVIHLAGHPLAGRFTTAHKEKVRSSRVAGTELIAKALADAETRDPRGRALINGSAVGFYGATPEQRSHSMELLTEDLPAGTDFLAEVCRAWEQATESAHEAGVRVVMIRTGIVQSPAGGVLQQMLPLFAAGLGGPLGDDQWQSWISIDDIASLFVHTALSPSVEGPVNGVGPEPASAQAYARVLADVLRRPAALPVPSLGPKLLLGEQGARELALADQRASAEKALGTGFGFRHPSLEAALRHVLGR
ncbi:TIGR01777 family oxidoreductase [Nesterenkonia ebinurensis]|uniref:TIGR01777 family oxidoreductase n=1 Tax=Nesterenkonia ebinurensis TaxID=2608252 RepID=UPI00123C7FD3|nr:TIGR01777 family oxidoreductase [Nesterenkonia ebinurensis]